MLWRRVAVCARIQKINLTIMIKYVLKSTGNIKRVKIQIESPRIVVVERLVKAFCDLLFILAKV